MGVSRPVNCYWLAATIVVVKKADGSIRLCADLSTGPDVTLEGNAYPLPAPENLFTILNSGSCFSRLNLEEVFLEVEIHDDSLELLTINMHRGLYEYQRLPFGDKTPRVIFQQIMDTLLAGATGVAAYWGDIVVVGQSRDG